MGLVEVSVLPDGEADPIGVGRPFCAEPDLAARLLADEPAAARCRDGDRCVPAQVLGLGGGCCDPEVVRAARAGRAAS